MGATDAVAKLLKPGDEVITGNDLYGGTYRMFTKVFANYGIKFHFVDLHDAQNIILHRLSSSSTFNSYKASSLHIEHNSSRIRIAFCGNV